TITRATVEAVNKRVPLFVGCTALNSREVVQRIRVARDAGADGVLIGVPFYFPSTVENAVRYFHDVGELFPDLSIMIYHNPALHRGDVAAARDIILDGSRLSIGGNAMAPLSWRETASKLAIAKAGYCEPGPLRPPFVEIPDQIRERADKFAGFWQELCARYRP